MHECQLCGSACFCDMEDHGQPAPSNCTHECAPESDEDDFWEHTCAPSAEATPAHPRQLRHLREAHVSERGILFSAPMVRALLDGTKSQTRRVVKPQPTQWTTGPGLGTSVIWPAKSDGRGRVAHATCPYGQPGDLLYVRENFCVGISPRPDGLGIVPFVGPLKAAGELPGRKVAYAASWEGQDRPPWRSSRYMPKWAARIWLRVTDVRVERLQEITEEDAIAEGVEHPPEPWPNMGMGGGSAMEADAQDRWRARYGTWHVDQYLALWDSLNAGRGYEWASNPWVWVVTFERTVAPR